MKQVTNMAVDKKSDYVGNNGGAYTDGEGMSRQFTYIDHDKKAKISTSLSSKTDYKQLLSDYRLNLLERILSIPASLCPEIFQDFTVRGEMVRIEWIDVMLRDEGLSLERLRTLCVMLENTPFIRNNV
jgi:hypothetical protein